MDAKDVVLPSEGFQPVSIVAQVRKEIANLPEDEAKAAADKIAEAQKNATSAKQFLDVAVGILGGVVGILK